MFLTTLPVTRDRFRWSHDLDYKEKTIERDPESGEMIAAASCDVLPTLPGEILTACRSCIFRGIEFDCKRDVMLCSLNGEVTCKS